MSGPLLHSVVDDLLDSIEQRPELAEPVLRFIFDGSQMIREGLSDIRLRDGGQTRHADGSVTFNCGAEVQASRELVQFAHAVANGVVPHMPLRGDAAPD